MDHVVRINEGSDTKAPIVLHLLPGEETLFNLVIINDGEPSDISLLASNPVIKAIRFRRSDDHVDGKQIIPIFARMPADTDRLDGEIILKSSNGQSRVPITILRDSQGPKSDRLSGTEVERPDRSGPSRRLGRVSSRARIRDIAPAEGVQKEDYQEEERNPDEDEVDAYGIDRDIIDPDGMDEGDEDDDHEDEGHGPYDSSEDPDTEFIPAKDDRSEEGEEDDKDGRHLSFSKDQDLERYRSGRRFRRVEEHSETDGNNHNHERIGTVREKEYSSRNDDYFAADDYSDRDRIDRSIDQPDPFDPTQEDRLSQRDGAAEDLESFFGIRAGQRAPFGSEERVERDEIPREQADSDQIHSFEEIEDGIEEEDSRTIGMMQIIPAIIFLSLVVALVLTFITESIPEFPGALVSSILIVTLIIYGAATLLKA